MPALPTNPQPAEVCTSCKHQAPLNDNGELVTIPALKKKRSVPDQTGKKKNAPAKPGPQKSTSLKSLPNKLAPSKRKPSVEIEDMPKEDNQIGAEVPCNLWNILEAADGSDDDENNPLLAAIDINSTLDEEDIVEIVDDPEEKAKAELGLYLFAKWNG